MKNELSKAGDFNLNFLYIKLGEATIDNNKKYFLERIEQDILLPQILTRNIEENHEEIAYFTNILEALSLNSNNYNNQLFVDDLLINLDKLIRMSIFNIMNILKSENILLKSTNDNSFIKIKHITEKQIDKIRFFLSEALEHITAMVNYENSILDDIDHKLSLKKINIPRDTYLTKNLTIQTKSTLNKLTDDLEKYFIKTIESTSHEEHNKASVIEKIEFNFYNFASYNYMEIRDKIQNLFHKRNKIIQIEKQQIKKISEDILNRKESELNKLIKLESENKKIEFEAKKMIKENENAEKEILKICEPEVWIKEKEKELSRGKQIFMKYKSMLYDIICKNNQPQEWINNLLNGNIRSLILGIIYAINAKYDVVLGIAVPLASLLATSGIANYCKIGNSHS